MIPSSRTERAEDRLGLVVRTGETLTPREAARASGRSEAFIYALVRRGLLFFIEDGRGLRIVRASLDAYTAWQEDERAQ